jgi:hypothetical protein
MYPVLTLYKSGAFYHLADAARLSKTASRYYERSVGISIEYGFYAILETLHLRMIEGGSYLQVLVYFYHLTPILKKKKMKKKGLLFKLGFFFFFSA